MSKYLTPAFIAGLLSSGIFLLVFGLQLGFLFMFLPTLPLFSLGLGKTEKPVLPALFGAALVIALAGGWQGAVFYTVFLALPAYYVIKHGLLSRPLPGGEKEWFPLGLIFVRLSIYACVFLNLGVMFYVAQDLSLPQLWAQSVHEMFADKEGQYGDVIDALATSWSPLIFAVTLWLWALALYAHGWAANRALVKRHTNIRPDFEMCPFTIPTWMLPLLAIGALASLIGSESMQFAGKASLVTLLLPYFLLGASLMHIQSKRWPYRGIFLFIIYFMTILLFWPALIIAGMGLWHQIKHLNKHLPAGGS